MRISSLCRPLGSCLFASALALNATQAQTTTHSSTVTDNTSSTASNSQTDTVTATTDKEGKPLPSPRHQLAFTHEGNGARTRIVLTYGAPSVRGRTIFGGEVVPYGHWWRAGANEATSFVTNRKVRIGNLTVPAGSYTLDVLPAESGWQLIVNRQTGQWGTDYDPAKDLGRVPMRSAAPAAKKETLSYSFDSISGTSATLHLRWADRDESVVVSYPGS